jgi:FkbH-like protein
MIFPELKEIKQILNDQDFSSFEKMKLVISHNITVDGLVPYLRYMGLEAQLDINVVQGEFDSLAQDALNGNPDLFDGADVILVFHHGWSAAPDLFEALPGLKIDDVQGQVEALQIQIPAIIKGLRSQSDAMIIWAGFETPVEPAYGIADPGLPAGQMKIVSDLNSCLIKNLTEVGSAFFLDMDRLVSQAGARSFYDPRTWSIARTPYGASGFAEISNYVGRFIRALKGRSKKCLVLDCDNVLWGGVVGEAGIKGIKVSQAFPGNNFRKIQQIAVNLYNRGIILALCSKNNEEDVWQVFDEHQEMLLKRNHIAAWRINWQDKASNLVELAEEMNIGLDSMVFLDDSVHETELVRSVLPEITTVHLDHQNLARCISDFSSAGHFDTLSLTDEDKKRGDMYRDNAARNRSAAKFTDVSAYMRSLHSVLELGLSREADVPRVAQLTQKTNQFNLTTKRYNESEIDEFMRSDSKDVISCSVEDRFGNYGLVGVCLLDYQGPVAEIDTLLLSCRVLGRGVEESFLTAIADYVRNNGRQQLVARRIPTKKNVITSNYLPDNALSGKSVLENGTEEYRYDLAAWSTNAPEYVDVRWSRLEENDVAE